MKVYMGPYTRYFGPYDLAEMLKYVGVSEERRYGIGEWLSLTWVGKSLQKLNDLNKRKIKIRIDPYDTWSMDHTLSLIVVPMLIQLKETMHTVGWVDNEDVPEHLHTKDEPADDIGVYHHPLTEQKWIYVLDEMIWAFQQSGNDELISFYDQKNDTFDLEGHEKYQQRVKNGLRLFGKYYQALWD